MSETRSGSDVQRILKGFLCLLCPADEQPTFPNTGMLWAHFGDYHSAEIVDEHSDWVVEEIPKAEVSDDNKS